MTDTSKPRPFDEWRSDPFDRAEDAAYTFGYHLIKHCREEALKAVEECVAPTTSHEFKSSVEKAVDTALHNVVDLIEGFWRTKAGPAYLVEYALAVRVRKSDGALAEEIEISPCLLDLPIGYWKWRDGGVSVVRMPAKQTVNIWGPPPNKSLERASSHRFAPSSRRSTPGR